MAKPKRPAPVNYRVPFSTAEPDVSRMGTDPGAGIPWYQEPTEMARAEGRRWMENPLGRAKDYGTFAVRLADPMPSTREAVQSIGEFTKQPSWKGAGSAAGHSALAALDWLALAAPAAKAAKVGKVARIAEAARMGRY